MSMIHQRCDTESQATAREVECGNKSSKGGDKHTANRLSFPGAGADRAGSCPLDAETTPVLPHSWLMYSDSHPNFSSCLLAMAGQAALKADSDSLAKPGGHTQAQGQACHTDAGYFEMGQGGGEHTLSCGEQVLGSGEHTLPCGEQALGSGEHTLPCGEQALGSGEHTLPCGEQALGSGEHTLPCGEQALGSGEHTLPCGEQALGSGEHTLLCGEQALGSGEHTLLCGEQALGSGEHTLPCREQALGSGEHTLLCGEQALGSGEHTLRCREPALGSGEHTLGCAEHQALGCESPETEQEQEEVLWAVCVHSSEETRLFAGCVVVTSEVVAVFRTPQPDLRGETLLLSQLQLMLCFPYSHILALRSPDPELWLSVRLKAGDYLCVIADSNSLNSLYERVKAASPDCCTARSILQLPPADSQTHFIAYILLTGGGEAIPAETLDTPAHTRTSLCSLLLPVREEQLTPTSLPCLLVLTAQWLHAVKVDFCTTAKPYLDGVGVSDDVVSRQPLAAVLLDPSEGEGDAFCHNHVAHLLVGSQLVSAVFVLPQDKARFLQLFTRLRAELQGIKTILVHKLSPGHSHAALYSAESAGQTPDTARQSNPCRSQMSLSLRYPAESLLHTLSEENQCPSHLPVSPALSHLTALTGTGLWEFFHRSVAEVENEELRHVTWASVVFYTRAEQEMPACLMLSTSAVYLLLGDGGTQPGQGIVYTVSPCGQRYPQNTTCCLRSSGSGLLLVPRVLRSTLGGRAFSHYAPRLWNCLPHSLHLAHSLPIFRSLLKTFLYDRAFGHLPPPPPGSVPVSVIVKHSESCPAWRALYKSKLLLLSLNTRVGTSHPQSGNIR
uniref:Uncharacterized protein n=1 Tax=Callorhinchus milii TaxID=7868 RepID=A0A4W3HNI0_CALMI